MKGDGTNSAGIIDNLIWIGVGLAALFWVLEAAIHAFIFHEGELIQQIFSPQGHEVWMRLFVMATFIAFAIYAQFIITQRRLAEEATIQAHEELNQIFNTAADGMRVIDKNFNILHVNDTFSTMSGISKEEAVGRKCYELLCGPLCHTPECPLIRILGGEERIECDTEKERIDGVKVSCIVTATPFVEYGGEVVGIVEDFKEISDRKRSEEQLQQSEKKYSTLVENSLTGIYIDQDGKIAFANNRFAEIYGYAKDELIGMESWKLVYIEDRDLTNEIRKKRLTGEESPLEYEARGLRKDGEIIWILRRNTRIEYKGSPAILGNIVDITKRKRVEESLRDSQVRYRTVLEASPDPVVVYDMDGQCIYLNPAFTRVFGWTPEELLGKKVNYVPDRNWPETQMMIDKVLAGESFSGIESRRYNKAGKILEVSISAAIYVNREGIPVGSVHILRDITQQKRVEEELQRAHDELEQRVEERTAKLAKTTEQLKLELTERKRAEEALRLAHRDLAGKAADLEAANEELSDYAYVVSHDLGAPLRAIHNYADFLREDLEGILQEEERTYLDYIDNAVRQGQQLVQDLLELSRVGKGSGPIEGIDMGVFLKKLIAHLDLSSDVEVVIGNGWPTIEAETTLLWQIFQNLISNAVKFNISAPKRVEIGWLPVGEEHYEMFVRDNGIGIEPRHHEQIFQVFQRLHTREEYEGTGLGLAIVKKATGKLRGSVRLESKPGEGSTFFVALPKTQKEG